MLDTDVKQFVNQNVNLINSEDWVSFYDKVILDDKVNLKIHKISNLLYAVGLNPANFLPKIFRNFLAQSYNIADLILDNYKLISIEPYAFMECLNLKVVNLAKCESLRTISISAFSDCYYLETLILPSKSLLSINSLAFSFCNNLKTIKFMGTCNEWNKIDFGISVWKNVPCKKVTCLDGECKLKKT